MQLSNNRDRYRKTSVHCTICSTNDAS